MSAVNAISEAIHRLTEDAQSYRRSQKDIEVVILRHVDDMTRFMSDRDHCRDKAEKLEKQITVLAEIAERETVRDKVQRHIAQQEKRCDRATDDARQDTDAPDTNQDDRYGVKQGTPDPY